jgi:hypothetical protein
MNPFLAAALVLACSSKARRQPTPVGGLAPFALQFAGVYDAPAAPPAAPSWVELARDGTYVARAQGSSVQESGTFGASATVVLPLTFQMTPDVGSAVWTATITDYDGQLHVSAAAGVSILAAVCTVGPNEALCDATAGSWTDDDADPTTGLYCLCPPGTVYLPSEGGCVP